MDKYKLKYIRVEVWKTKQRERKRMHWRAENEGILLQKEGNKETRGDSKVKKGTPVLLCDFKIEYSLEVFQTVAKET